MEAIFLNTFISNAAALGKILLIAVIAGLLVRKRVFSSFDIVSISSITIKVLLPSMIFSNIVKNLKPAEFPNWWLLPLIGIALILVGVLFSVLLFGKSISAKKSLIPIASMQNAGYLALPLGQVIYPDQFEQYALYCFLIIMGLNPILWSVGKLLSTHSSDSPISWKQIITPPFAANILGVFTVLSGLGEYLPSFVLDVVELTGTATVPVANFILGAVIGSITIMNLPPASDIFRVLGIKYLIIPLVTVLFMLFWNLKSSNPLLADTILIQAASPPATAILIQIKNYGGDEQRSGSMMLLAYMLCLIMIPLWLSIWKVAI